MLIWLTAAMQPVLARAEPIPTARTSQDQARLDLAGSGTDLTPNKTLTQAERTEPDPALLPILLALMLTLGAGAGLTGDGPGGEGQAEPELAEGEQDYLRVFNATKDAVVAYDPQTGLILDANKPFTELYGFSREEMMGQPAGLNRYSNADFDPNRADENFRRTVEEGPQIFEWRARHKNGQLFWVQVKLVLASLAGKSRELAFVRSISEEKAAAMEKEAVANLSVLFLRDELAADVMDQAAEIIATGFSFNRACINNYDQATEKINLLGSYNLTDPENINRKLPPAKSPDALVSVSGERIVGTVTDGTVNNPAGRILEDRDIKSIISVPIRRGDEVMAVLTLGHTEEVADLEVMAEAVQVVANHLALALRRMEARTALAESESRYRALVEQAEDAIYMLDEQMNVIFANRAYYTNLGFNPEDKFYAVQYSYIHPDDIEKVKTEERILRTTGRHMGGFRARHRDGSWRHLVVRATRISSGPNRPVRYLCIARDVTDQIQAQAENEALQAQLRQAQKMEAIGTLAGGIAHDFNNILAAIIGNSELARMDLEPDHPVQRNLKQIMSSSNRAKTLVRQILSFSRKTETEIEPVDLIRLLGEASGMLRSTIPTTVSILKEINIDSAVVLADPAQIHQVVMNLATNAAQAMEDSGGVLKFELERLTAERDFIWGDKELGPGRYIKLTVSDTGPGMKPETLARVFEPFFTTKPTGRGTGMGLAVVHGIVNHSGGAISALSYPGQGAAFSVLLPEGEPASDAETEQPVDRPAPAGGRETILFVDDEEPLRMLGRKMLEKLGYRVLTAASAMEALEVFEASGGDLDLVITDQTMPKMTGDRLAAEMMKRKPGLPVILCTGYSASMTPEKAAEKGISHYLTKPLETHRLAEAIRELLDKPV